MKIQKVFVVIFLYFLFQLVISCCDCPKSSIHYFKYKSIITSNLDNSDEIPIVSETNVIPKIAFGIRLKLSFVSLLTCNNAAHIGFSQLYAYDCFCPPTDQFIVSDTLCAIDIRTVYDFDDSHPANSIITEYFKVFVSDRYYPITDFIKNQHSIKQYSKPENQIIDLFLLTPPRHSGEHRFRIEIKISDYGALSTMTQAVNLE